MALSISFDLRWDGRVENSMGNWAREVLAQLSRREAADIQSTKLQLHRAEIKRAKGMALFAKLSKDAEEGVKILSQHVKELTFTSISDEAFRVATPHQSVEVAFIQPGLIHFKQNLGPSTVQGQFDIEVDVSDGISLVYQGRMLGGRTDEVLRIAINPLFGLPIKD